MKLPLKCCSSAGAEEYCS